MQIGNTQVSLAFMSTEYNCSVKLVGRLTVKVGDKTHYVDGDLHEKLMKKEIKDELIRELGRKMVSTDTYPTLMTTSPYFPHDSGKYLPNYLLYADSIQLSKGTYWYAAFKALIRELQENEYHGFKVFELPMYMNNTYGGSFWPSKVWGIVPPDMVPRIITNECFNLPIVKDSFSRIITQGHSSSLSAYTPKDIEYAKSIILKG